MRGKHRIWNEVATIQCAQNDVSGKVESTYLPAAKKRKKPHTYRLTLRRCCGKIPCNMVKATERKPVTLSCVIQRAVGGCKTVLPSRVNSFRKLHAEGNPSLSRLCRVRPLYRRGVLAPRETSSVRKSEAEWYHGL